MISNTAALQNTVQQITNGLKDWFNKINEQTVIGQIDESYHWDASDRDKEIAIRAKSLSADYNYFEEFVKSLSEITLSHLFKNSLWNPYAPPIKKLTSFLLSINDEKA